MVPWIGPLVVRSDRCHPEMSLTVELEFAPMVSPRIEFISGVKAELPIVLGVIPFAMIYGVLALSAGLSPFLAQAMSLIVFAGSAQFIGVQLMGVAAPPLVLLLTTFVVNLRHMLYSAAMSPRVSHLSNRWRWLLAYLLTDEAYVVTALRYDEEFDSLGSRHYFFLGAGLTLWCTWQISTAAGILLGSQIPPSWSLDFALALTFIGLMVPTLKSRPNAAAAITAGIVAIATHDLPLRIGLLLAAVAGISVGVWMENRLLRKESMTKED